MKNLAPELERALQKRRRVAAKMTPRFPDAVAWVWVAPHTADSRLPTAMRRPDAPIRYYAQYFEVEARLVEEEQDFHPSQLLFDEHHDCATLEELDELLGRWVGDASKFRLLDDWPDKFPY